MHTLFSSLLPATTGRVRQEQRDRQRQPAEHHLRVTSLVSLSLGGYKDLIVSSITWKMLKERCKFNTVSPQPRVSVTRKRDGGFTLTVFVYKWPLSRIPEVTGMTGASTYSQGHQQKRVLAFSVHMSTKLECLVLAYTLSNTKRNSLLQYPLIGGISNRQEELTSTQSCDCVEMGQKGCHTTNKHLR